MVRVQMRPFDSRPSRKRRRSCPPSGH
jgi:hypothetical protein